MNCKLCSLIIFKKYRAGVLYSDGRLKEKINFLRDVVAYSVSDCGVPVLLFFKEVTLLFRARSLHSPAIPVFG